VIGVVLHTHDFPVRRVRIHQGSRLEIIIVIHRTIIAERQRKVERGMPNWSPQVQNLVPVLQKPLDITFGQVSANSDFCRLVSLINVDEGDWVSVFGSIWQFVVPAYGSSGVRRDARWPRKPLTVVEQNDPTGSGQFFDEFDTLGVVFRLDLLVVIERCVLSSFSADCKAGSIKRMFTFFPANTFDLDGLGDLFPVALSVSCEIFGLRISNQNRTQNVS
jgi:hypothetical protein